jgi:hypothetical protein
MDGSWQVAIKAACSSCVSLFLAAMAHLHGQIRNGKSMDVSIPTFKMILWIRKKITINRTLILLHEPVLFIVIVCYSAGLIMLLVELP